MMKIELCKTLKEQNLFDFEYVKSVKSLKKLKKTGFEIPEELFLHILDFLIQDYRDLLKLQAVDKNTYNIIQNHSFWKVQLFKIFPKSKQYITKNYKDVFLKAYQKYKKSDKKIKIGGNNSSLKS